MDDKDFCLVKVNGILVKVNGIRHYSFIDLI
jgi:hypothetical protein